VTWGAQRFDRAQLVTFVRALDRNLEGPARLLIVGGAAATLAYGANTNTSDIDVLNVLAGSDADIAAASSNARRQTNLAVDVSPAAVAELPYNYEDRVKELRLGLRRLALVVPDKYDLVLSKAIRGWDNDLATIEAIHKHHRLARTTLLGRFETEVVKIATADPRNLRFNMLAIVDRLYGSVEKDKLARLWFPDLPTEPRPARSPLPRRRKRGRR
jgi:hypothetical protein